MKTAVVYIVYIAKRKKHFKRRLSSPFFAGERLKTMSKDTFIKGAALLTVTMLITKILGFAYVIPFTAMVGTEGFLLFEYAYKPYALMLSLSMLGIPMAVSKFVSKYNQLNDYETGLRLFKSGLVVMTITGLFWASILYLSAPFIANMLIDETQSSGSAMSDVVFVIRMISFALIVVPPMSLLRGFFQGYQKMQPTAISQMVEQFVRIIVILLAALIIMTVGSHDIKLAVGLATFAATIGALASIIVLVKYWKKYNNEFKALWQTGEKKEKVNLLNIYKEVFYFSIPFVAVGLAIPMYQNIDIFTINPALIAQGLTQKEAEYINSIVALVQKITTIPIVFANAFALTLVPAITKSFVGNEIGQLHQKITKTFQIILFVTVPCSIYMFVFPESTYGVLLGTRDALYGGNVTQAYAFIALFFSFFVVTSAILQGINKQYFSILSLGVGLVAKFMLITPLLNISQMHGAAFSTMIGFGISISINLFIIGKYARFSYRKLLKDSLKVVGISIVTLLFALGYKYLFGFIEYEASQYIKYLIEAVTAGLIVLGVYIGISYKTGILFQYLGDRVNLSN